MVDDSHKHCVDYNGYFLGAHTHHPKDLYFSYSQREIELAKNELIKEGKPTDEVSCVALLRKNSKDAHMKAAPRVRSHNIRVVGNYAIPIVAMIFLFVLI